MKLPDAQLCHQVRGRLRIKIPSKKGDSVFFENLKESFGNSGITSNVVINPLTASIVVFSDDNLEKISEFAREKNLFDLKTVDMEKRKVINYTVKQAYKSIDTKFKNFFNNEIDLGNAVFLTLIGLTLYQIARGNFGAPAWYTSLWYALNIFLKNSKEGDVS